MTDTAFSLLEKNTCVHKENLCNHLLPFSMAEFRANKKFTQDEKDENLNKYKLACKNQTGRFTSCCDKNDKNLDKLMRAGKLPKLKGRVEYDRYDKLKSVELCGEDDKKCKGGRRLTGYEMCKIGEDYDDKILDGKIKDFNSDCFSIQCNPQEKVPNILGTITENYTYTLDNNLSEAIKKNDTKLVRYYVQKDPSLKKRVLTHNQEGNTIFHEALKFNSGDNLYYIFKQANKEIAYKQNLAGDTILHMAMCNENPNAIMFSIRLGCDINEKNNLGETPIYCAIKNNLINNVRIAINNIASLENRNKKGDTPLMSALRLEKKNIDIIRLLIERGSYVNARDSEKKTPLEIINDIEDPIKEDEEVRTYLEQVTLQNMGIKIGEQKNLTKEESDKLKGIVYQLSNEEGLDTEKHKFTVNIDYTGEGENYYPDDLEEKHMQPYKPGEENLSHEPYFNKFKNLQKDKLEVLRKTVLLTKWDNKHSKNKKLEIIDQIMNDTKDFDSYKFEVLHDNGIKVEQEHMIFKDYSPAPRESVTVKVEGEDHTPYNIHTDEEILNSELLIPSMSPAELETEIINNFAPSETQITLSPTVLDRSLLEIILESFTENSVPILILAIILTMGIIFFMYTRSKMVVKLKN